MKILIAEDERISRLSLERQIVAWGHEASCAADGEDAWSQFQDGDFEIVISDWEMPKMNGLQLIEKVRADSRPGYVYVIMLTAPGGKADLVDAMDAAADDFLSKPFDKNELRVRLNAGERIIRLERASAAQNAALANANQRMKRDLDAAAQVQRDLLPRNLPDSLGARFEWHFEPCDELGGDILNVLPLSARCIALYLLDVAGHGVPAALLSVSLSRFLNTKDPSSSILFIPSNDGEPAAITAPKDVIGRLNVRFPMESQGGRFFTMIYALFDVESGVLRYALAGQPPPILVRSDHRPKQLEGSGYPVGVVDDAEWVEYDIQLQPGDQVFFYSDGITEAGDIRQTHDAKSHDQCAYGVARN